MRKSAQERNLKLNKEKSQIRLKEISVTFSANGVRPDPKKVRAITQPQAPKNKEELQRFLGMTTYLSKFIPNYSQTSAPLRTLLEKWHWEEQQKSALSTLITNAPVLRYFNPSNQTTISVDARDGCSPATGRMLNCLCIQVTNSHPTKLRSNLRSNLKEMLAIVFGCKKFHDYVYGIPNITVETDHKPLETILTKPLPARLIMSIQKHPIHVIYKPGKELLIADTAPLPDEANELEFQQYDINLLPVTTKAGRNQRTNRRRHRSSRPTQNDTRWLARNEIRCTPWCQTILELSR